MNNVFEPFIEIDTRPRVRLNLPGFAIVGLIPSMRGKEYRASVDGKLSDYREKHVYSYLGSAPISLYIFTGISTNETGMVTPVAGFRHAHGGVNTFYNLMWQDEFVDQMRSFLAPVAKSFHELLTDVFFKDRDGVIDIGGAELRLPAFNVMLQNCRFDRLKGEEIKAEEISEARYGLKTYLFVLLWLAITDQVSIHATP